MSAERNCRTCTHAKLPTRHPTCRQCLDSPGLVLPNWASAELAAPVAPDTGYGCQTCKFTALGSTAAPCRGCWSPSVSGKGSNWTAP